MKIRKYIIALALAALVPVTAFAQAAAPDTSKPAKPAAVDWERLENLTISVAIAKLVLNDGERPTPGRVDFLTDDSVEGFFREIKNQQKRGSLDITTFPDLNTSREKKLSVSMENPKVETTLDISPYNVGNKVWLDIRFAYKAVVGWYTVNAPPPQPRISRQEISTHIAAASGTTIVHRFASGDTGYDDEKYELLLLIRPVVTEARPSESVNFFGRLAAEVAQAETPKSPDTAK